ncbi:HAMP domain-containing histidine kinase [Patescibacteria group bacterium]|nr:HAMP domain-containing histidine kinase [Patescibacteria group bacterium]
MPDISKPFGAWATAIRTNLFEKARFRLTVIYIAIIAVILFIFSQAIIVAFGRNIRTTAHRFARSDEEEFLFVQEAEDQMHTVLFVLDAGILILAGGLGFVLAGKTLTPIRETLEQQKQFLSDASHELRTPLAVLKTNIEVELAGKKESEPMHRQNLVSNLEEVNRMAGLVNELLLLSRLDNREAPPVTKRLDVSLVLHDATARLLPYAKKRHVALRGSAGSGKLSVNGNREELLSAFTNVIKNAIDYTDNGGSVTVDAVSRDGHVTVTIADTGTGIPGDQLPFIFNRFYRGEKSRTKNADGGSGLGLPIAQAIVREHGGDIAVQSAPAKGTTITIRLPKSRNS